MIKKVALFAAASVLSFGIAATTYAEDAHHEGVKCVRALAAGETEHGKTADGKLFVVEDSAEACTGKGGVVAQ
ncbi:MAG: hypothetical protein K0R02_847 [Rickettsiaceae bacterium]|jgi:hypothetical protein|nr:hypothetical protein [Rickettsiaceae bacterium]